MVSFLDELIYPFEKLLRMSIDELNSKYDVPGLEEVINEIKSMDKYGYYKKLYKVQKMDWKIVDDSGVFTKEENQKIRLRLIAYQNLSHRNLRLDFAHSPIKMDFINFPTFQTIYNFLEYVYYMNNNSKKLNHQDELNVYFSGLDERILFYLNKFDEVTELPEITPEFFQRLKKVKWKNSETSNFESLLYCSMGYAGGAISGSDLAFDVLVAGFICLLMACSAVTQNRDKINKEDVIKAYKTYFKLIKTDTTKYKARPEIIRELNSEHRGYLVCKNCGGYYKLQPSESPEDFDRCQCGGELEHKNI